MIKKMSRDEIIQQIIAHGHGQFTPAEEKLVTKFMLQYFAVVSLEDLLERDTLDAYTAALSHWKFAEQRKPHEAKIRIFNPTQEQYGWQSRHTIIEISHDDMPFLVDSARMVINRHNLSVHLIIHTGGLKFIRDTHNTIVDILPFEETKIPENCNVEAVIYIEIDRQTDVAFMEQLRTEFLQTFHDVYIAVSDWKKMLQKVNETVDNLEKFPGTIALEELEENKAFLLWLADNHFTFLGCRDYELVTVEGEKGIKLIVGSGLGVLRDETQIKPDRKLSELPSEAARLLLSPQMLVIYKTNTKSTIHRPAYTDGIDVKMFDAEGNIRIRRFIGLYTSIAYNSNPKDIPFLGHKVSKVVENAKLSPGGHASKVLLNILETFPRDDLFQMPMDELTEMTLGILGIQERPRIRLFVRKDIYNRFVSCLVYLPLERFNTELCLAMQNVLLEAFDGSEASFSTRFSESILACIHFVVRTDPKKIFQSNIDEIEKKLIKISRLWTDELHESLVEYFGEEKGNLLSQRYGRAFESSYRENFPAQTAVADIEQIEGLTDANTLGMDLYQSAEVDSNVLGLKLYSCNRSISLSDVLPMLENMGLRILGERPYPIVLSDGKKFWINDFSMVHEKGLSLNIDEVKNIFQQAFRHIWFEDAESDGFNALVFSALMDWREVVVLRACAKYLRQTGFTFSQPYIEETLVAYPDIARSLVDIFKIRMNPALDEQRDEKIQSLDAILRAAFEQVSNLDQDRILRRFLDVIYAMSRTNYFQPETFMRLQPYLSFKLNPARIPDLPLPLPLYEIFVYSPRFEGVHLRNAKVARGGIRWSDRREDFRTEILGLMKAQVVKNAVIVPSGAKGGFVPKHLPTSGSREDIMKEGIACYQNFIRALLDVTDNLEGDQIIVPPATYRHDDDDPYLVVAADKGTATFSDIANAISAEYNFWLGDAFASGGSVGYDHKKMGITARGAWKSVEHHFRRMDLDPATMPFSVVGIGDMSGDVFGNGLLLSRQIKLVAAFNHMHIFLDPNPNPEMSFQERERLFHLPRSSWQDYNPDLISAGGGIYLRSAKSIPLTPEVKKILAVEQDSMIPTDLIHAILKAPVDLIWNGGIGTYVKATSERHSDVGDRANDLLRVNGNDLRCRVFAEGGNLGVTQLGRVEYALNGGKINTDFIDNSAGVDCSDNEVNIKILLNTVVSKGKMTLEQRNILLSQMTEEVVDLVLTNNIYQNTALGLAEFLIPNHIDLLQRYIDTLEQEGLINRSLEFLPSNVEIAERKAAGLGLVRPEFAVLLAYSKTICKSEILDSDLPEDPYLSQTVAIEFPEMLAKQYRKEMDTHPLHREIIATYLSNTLMNELGVIFSYRLHEESNAEVVDIVKAYMIVRNIFNIPDIWQAIVSPVNVLKFETRATMLLNVMRLMRRASRWFLRNRPNGMDISAEIQHFGVGVQTFLDVMPLNVVAQARKREYMEAGAPVKLAEKVANMNALFSALDIVQAAHDSGFGIAEIVNIYFELSEILELTWFREQILLNPTDSHWDVLARAALRDDLDFQQRSLAVAVLMHAKQNQLSKDLIPAWIAAHQILVDLWYAILAELRAATTINFTMFTVALRELMRLITI